MQEMTPQSIAGANVPIDPQLESNSALANSATCQARDLIEAGKYSEAHVYIHKILRDQPIMEDLLQHVAIDCDLLSGHYDQALSESLRFLDRSRWGSPDDLGQAYAELSAATAGLGKIYPGQFEFCVRQVQKAHDNSWNGVRFIISAKPEGSNGLLALSFVAIGLGSAYPRSYLELALSLDPTNVTAGYHLTQFDEWAGQYSSLRRTAATMIANLKDESAREFFRAKVAAVAGLPDRPKRKPSNQNIIQP